MYYSRQGQNNYHDAQEDRRYSKISNENCTYWQAVFDPTVEMKLHALVEGMKAEKFGSKVFMINPDFEFGHAVDEGFKSLVGAGDTGLELVGAELMAPFGQVTDFTPVSPPRRRSASVCTISSP